MRKYTDFFGNDKYEYNNDDRQKALDVSMTALAMDLGYTPEQRGKR